MKNRHDNGLDRDELKDARRRSSPRVAIVYEAIRREGEEELERYPAALVWSGLAAGLSMGFSFLMEALLSLHLPDSDWTPLVAKFGYCIGFIIVILGRQQLFTRNTLTPVLQLLHRMARRTPGRGWAACGAWCWAPTWAGAAIFALLMLAMSEFQADLRGELTRIGMKVMGIHFPATLLSASSPDG